MLKSTHRRIALTIGCLAAMLVATGSASMLPANAASKGTAYGFTLPVPPDQAKVNASGAGWVRQGLDWSSIETAPGVYNFGTLDRAVAQENAAGIKLTVPIQDAPGFRKTQVCNGVNLFPGPAEVGTFAAILAARYNGRSGHGFVDSFEIGNEEWDGYWGGSWAATEPCRTATWYGPVLKAGYLAIKANSPTALVGMFGMWWVSSSHIASYMTWLYQNGYGTDMDFANFHYYPGRDPSVTVGDSPSYPDEWRLIHGVMSQYGDANKPIWCTEVGWAISSVGQAGNPIVSPAQQSDYLHYVLDNSRTSGIVQRVFIYTLMDNSDGMNIWPPSGPLPAYNMLTAYIAGYPSGARVTYVPRAVPVGAAPRAAATAAKPSASTAAASPTASPPSASAYVRSGGIADRRSVTSSPLTTITRTLVATTNGRRWTAGLLLAAALAAPLLGIAALAFVRRRRRSAADPESKRLTA